MTTRTKQTHPNRVGWSDFGPGIVTGVADDDPSGISTYTIVGATQGYSLLWTSLVTLPMNFAVQSICARVGLVTGHGLAGTMARHYGRRWLFLVVALLFVANVVNIAADLGAIAAAFALLVPVPAALLVVVIGPAIALVEVVVPYHQFARYLKVLTLVVFAYVVGAFAAHPDWGQALRGTFAPHVLLNRDLVASLVALLGTTISPYLFFWQTSQEVEEELERPGMTGTPARLRNSIRRSQFDVGVGMLMANAGFYFVVLTAAAALWANGRHDVQTAAQAAEALRPLAGSAASLLFAMGIIGTGLLAIPVLAGSVAYATAELFGWHEGLSESLRRAPQFYAVIALATLLGVAIVFSPIPELEALYIAAIVNGVTAPILLVFLMVTARDSTILGEYRIGRGLLWGGWATTAAMAAAALGLAAVSL